MKTLCGGCFGLAAVATVVTLDMAAAQNTSGLAIDRYSCRDLLRESGTDRDVAVAFIHGYLLGKTGATVFARETARAQAAKFIEYCLDDPKQSALEAMTRAAAGGADARATNPPRP
jgi:hypothetical protein